MLSELDRQIINAVVEEKTNAEIAKMFNLSVRGVEQKIKRYCQIFKVKGRIGLVREFLKTVS